jgi:hypothetical protein
LRTQKRAANRESPATGYHTGGGVLLCFWLIVVNGGFSAPKKQQFLDTQGIALGGEGETRIIGLPFFTCYAVLVSIDNTGNWRNFVLCVLFCVEP